MTQDSTGSLGEGGYDPAAYGEAHAEVYDEIYRDAFPTEDAVRLLGRLAAGGGLLELGVGTGRLARPLAAAGVAVHGLDSSPAMLAALRAREGGPAVTTTLGDLTGFDLGAQFAVVVCAASTLFLLPTPQAQIAALACAARHLAAGGALVVETFVPQPDRFTDGRRTELRRLDEDQAHLVLSSHDPLRQQVEVEHVLAGRRGVRRYPVRLRYAWPAELDLMAQLAGLRLDRRWGGWRGEPLTAATGDQVSIYRVTTG